MKVYTYQWIGRWEQDTHVVLANNRQEADQLLKKNHPWFLPNDKDTDVTEHEIQNPTVLL